MGAGVIDEDGFRANVGIMLSNDQGQLLWARRIGCSDAWQFPQGGVNQGEACEEALFRELNEEVGLLPTDVKILDVTRGWLKYRLPPQLVRGNQQPVCIGQKQKWFLLKLLSGDGSINLGHGSTAEFDHWRWVSYWYPLDQVVAFKRKVYARALKALSPAHCRLQEGS